MRRLSFSLGFLCLIGVSLIGGNRSVYGQTAPKRPAFLPAPQTLSPATPKRTIQTIADEQPTLAPKSIPTSDDVFTNDVPRKVVQEARLFSEPKPYDPDGNAVKPPVTETAVAPIDTDDPRANWGLFDAPAQHPMYIQETEYLQGHLADGILQHEDDNLIRRNVLDPNEVIDPVYPCEGIDIYRPDGLAPIGVLGDHTLPAGGNVMVSYRYNRMTYDDNYNSDSRVTTASVLGAFPIAAQHMLVERHLVGLEWAPTNDLTLSAQLPYMNVVIDNVTAANAHIQTAFSNPADVVVSALYVLKRWERSQVHFNFGINLPVGFLDRQGQVPGPGSPDNSYPMRLSSGTWDFLPGLTYRGQDDYWTWGGQAIGTIHSGENRYNYTLGDSVNLTAWLSRKVTDSFSTSARVNGSIWGNIRGADANLDQTLVQTNRPDLQGGERIDILFGMNYNLCVPVENVPMQRLSIEAGLPVYQRLNGPQLGVQWMLTAGWQMMF